MPAAAAIAGAAFAQASLPVGTALERPAVLSRNPERAVLLGAALAGRRLVAVGERGIIVLSDDGGANWRQVPVSVSVTLTAVRFADEKQGFAVGHGGTVLVTSDGGASWTRRLDGRRIAQIEADAAKASGDPTALRSAQRLQAEGPDKPLLDVLVLDAQRAVVIGAYGLVLATEDGGQTWTSWRARVGNPKELHLYAVRRRADRLVIAGEQGLVLLSLDGGRSFVRLALPYAGSFFTLELPGDGGIVVAGLRGNVWRSDDGGANWSAMASPVPVSVTASALRADGTLVLANQAGMVLGAKQGALQPLAGSSLPPLNGVLPLAGNALLAVSMRGVHVLGKSPAKREP